MIELEPIKELLDLMGEDLNFDSGTIRGLPGFSTSAMYSGETSVYKVESTNYIFKVALADCIEFEVKIDSEFIYTDYLYNYTFKLDEEPIPFIDGWAELRVILVGRELL